MKTLILYDSMFGNTEKIAQAMAKEIPNTKVLPVNITELKDLKVDLLLVGSPTHGGRAKPEMNTFLEEIPSGALQNIKVAVFDTRLLESAQNFALKLLLKTIGYAAPKMAEMLTSKGCTLIAPPEGFIVTAKKGPLAEGELNRATKWAKSLTISS